MMKNFISIALLTGLLASPGLAEEEFAWREGQWVRQAPAARGTPAGEAALIRKHLDEKKYAKVVRAAKKFLKRYPASPLREEVMSLAGDAEMQRRRYWQAYQWYEKQLAAFPDTEGFEQCLDKEMEIARAFLSGRKKIVWGFMRLRAKGDGIDILQRIADHAPSSPQAESAIMAIGDHYFGKGRWRSAADAYEQFLKMFPRSSRSGQAELALAASLLRSYRGPMWDETPLIEAQQRYETFAAQYPAAARKANIEGVLDDIRSARAAKQYEIGRFYVRTGKPDAARRCFQLIAGKYANTKWAGRAKAEMAKLARDVRSG